jgi:hypothetical protein
MHARDTLRESHDDVPNPLGEIPQDQDGWLMGFEQGGLIEKYLRGDVGIAFRRTEPACGELIQEGFIVHCVKMLIHMSVQNGDPGIVHGCSNGQQPCVFPQDAELMEGVQKWVTPL